MYNPDIIKQLNKIRSRSKYCELIFAIFVAIITVVISIAPEEFHIGSSTQLLLFLVPFFTGFLLLLMYRKGAKQKFDTLYKQTFVASVLSNHFEHVTYDWERGFHQTIVEKFGLSDMGSTYHSEDYLYGVYNDVVFRQADVKIQYSATIDEKTDVFFDGRMFEFDYPQKDIEGVQVYTHTFKHAPSHPAGVTTTPISTDDFLFNKLFTVKVANEHDRSQFLTAETMRRIQLLYSNYGNLTLFVSKGKLYLGIMGISDFFDPPKYKKIDYATEKNRIDSEIQQIKNIIDILLQNSIM